VENAAHTVGFFRPLPRFVVRCGVRLLSVALIDTLMIRLPAL